MDNPLRAQLRSEQPRFLTGQKQLLPCYKHQWRRTLPVSATAARRHGSRKLLTPGVQRTGHSALYDTRLGRGMSTRCKVAAPEIAPPTPSAELEINFDNESDPDATTITVSGPDRPDLLVQLTGAFSALELTVVSANISTAHESGQVKDVFAVVTSADAKIEETEFDNIRAQLLALIGSSSKSSKPAIYGVVAAAEVKRLKPLSTSVLEGDASALELAAAEMAQAAASLVSIERELITLSSNKAEPAAISAKQGERSEAAALLERKMAAMEAVLAARRSTNQAPVVEEPVKEKELVPSIFAPPSLTGTTVGTGPASGTGYEIILQGFNWESHRQPWYKLISAKAREIADAGFTAIWLPPPSDSVSAQGYLPRDLYCLDSQYGTEAELRECISSLHENNIKVIADIVINHRCAHSQSPDGKWNLFGGRLAWDTSAICSNNHSFGGQGSFKPFEDYPAAPNVDHAQDFVREDLVGWLKYLRNNVGFDGWRFDFVKGYDGKFVKEYIDTTVPHMAFGEYWDTCSYTDAVLNYNQDSHRQRTVNWCDSTGGTAAAFDFTTKGILQEAMNKREYWRLIDNQGRPPGVMGMWPSRAITFLENHDTGSTLQHWPFPWAKAAEGYAYLLTHCGTPCVFWDHWVSDQHAAPISELLNVRQKAGINARSKVLIKKAQADVYAAVIDGKVAMKLGPGDWTPNKEKVEGKEWKVAASGPGFAVWMPADLM